MENDIKDWKKKGYYYQSHMEEDEDIYVLLSTFRIKKNKNQDILKALAKNIKIDQLFSVRIFSSNCFCFSSISL